MGSAFKISTDALELLRGLPKSMEVFLASWTKHMKDSGYLTFTTAKRHDCEQSFEWFVEPMISVLSERKGSVPAFISLVEEPHWAEKVMATARRHHLRGISFSMFVGCFKTLLYSIDDVIEGLNFSLQAKSEARLCVRRFADAYETVLIHDWVKDNQQVLVNQLEASNRQLALEKCKYENILASISDLVFMLDANGIVLQANKSAEAYFDGKKVLECPIWALFSFGVPDMHALVKGYAGKAHQLLHNRHDGGYFDVTLVPLNQISLASNAYLIVFTDVSDHIELQMNLEEQVAQRTADLLTEKRQLEGMNITLKNVLGSIQQQKEESLTAHLGVLKDEVLPIVRQLKEKKSKEAREACIEILEKQLLNVCSGVNEANDAWMMPSDFTPMERRICGMLRDGVSSKAIAQALSLSLETIHTHRKNIRKKLGLHGKTVKLFNYLNT